jgi:hypothetical protein
MFEDFGFVPYTFTAAGHLISYSLLGPEDI